MAMISLRQLLDHAAEHDYGVPAFNVNNLEQIHAIMGAAEDTRSPVVLQASAGASPALPTCHHWHCQGIPAGYPPTYVPATRR